MVERDIFAGCQFSFQSNSTTRFPFNPHDEFHEGFITLYLLFTSRYFMPSVIVANLLSTFLSSSPCTDAGWSTVELHITENVLLVNFVQFFVIPCRSFSNWAISDILHHNIHRNKTIMVSLPTDFYLLLFTNSAPCWLLHIGHSSHTFFAIISKTFLPFFASSAFSNFLRELPL